ncbi:hypothetical protein D3C71_2081580 [compost metagenome]
MNSGNAVSVQLALDAQLVVARIEPAGAPANSSIAIMPTPSSDRATQTPPPSKANKATSSVIVIIV